MEFYDIQCLVYEEYKKNGYLSMWNSVTQGAFGNLAEMGLVTTEVGEALEAIRDNDRDELALECADIVIRVLNFASRNRIDLEKVILAKNEKNLTRGKNHGRDI